MAETRQQMLQRFADYREKRHTAVRACDSMAECYWLGRMEEIGRVLNDLYPQITTPMTVDPPADYFGLGDSDLSEDVKRAKQ